MSHFPCIRPSLLNKKWIIQETKLNRIEIVRRKEEALLQKFKLISKQGNFDKHFLNVLSVVPSAEKVFVTIKFCRSSNHRILNIIV